MKILATAGVVAAGSIAVLAPAAYAGAQTHGSARHTKCNADWYVNPDETALQPKQLRRGLLFDGPSLIHHKPAAAYTLAHVPGSGFHAHLYKGVLPLFKLETSAPYSTVNKTANGKWWSSKIASGEGSQSQPVSSPGDLVGKGAYTDSTTVLSFGVGYATDVGNRALVTSVSFGGRIYGLACRPHHPKPTPTPSTSETGTPTPKPTASDSTAPGEAPTPTPVNSDLPVTG